MKLWLIRAVGHDFKTPVYVLVWATDRDDAAVQARPHISRLRGDSSNWDFLPLTEEDAQVFVALALHER
jgi:hypothetical protein